jgi:GNAT superfamily N-acetyltransferase
VNQYQVHARNAAAMWEALSEGYGCLLVGTEELRIVAPSPYHALRAIVVDPVANQAATVSAIADMVLGSTGVARRVVEDASGELDLSRCGLECRYRLSVMTRLPGARVPDAPAPGVRVEPVTDQETLNIAEQILIAIFPPPGLPAELRGRIQPVRVLGIAGWRVWLGYRDEVPAGAAYTYHDGSSLGVYQVGTLPEHRGHSVARAIMLAILRAYPDEVLTLSATEQGRPLYTGLGFDLSSEAVWWRPVRSGDDSGQGLR